MIYALYRCLYGEDFIQESITSIENFVDKIFVFWTDIPFGNAKSCSYKNKIIEFPKKIDRIVDKIRELDCQKIELIYDHSSTPVNQFSHLVNDIILTNYAKPGYIIFLEPDYVFREDQLFLAFEQFEKSNFLTATTKQIELWRVFSYSLPSRHRMASVFWNLKNISVIPQTGAHANYGEVKFLDAFVHNLGFCVSDINMYWKHLLALGFSEIIKDSMPNESWYEDKWLKWHPHTNNKNLEISRGYEHFIPHAQPYDEKQIPEIILASKHKWPFILNREEYYSPLPTTT